MSTALERARLFKARQEAAQAQAVRAPSAPVPQQPAYSPPPSSLPPTSSPLPPPNAQKGWPEFPGASSSAPQAEAPAGISPFGFASSPSLSPAPASTTSSAQDLGARLLSVEEALTRERSAQYQLKEEHLRALEQKQREIDVLKQQQQQTARSAAGPLTFERLPSSADALDALQLGIKADDKSVVAKYESLMESHPHLGRLWKGALFAVSIERTGSETLSQHLRRLNQEEIHAHFSSVELPVTEGLLASGEPVITKEELAAEKARSAKVDTKLNTAKRDLDAKITECATWREKAEDLLETREQPSRKTQVLQADLARVTEERDAIKSEMEKSAKNAEKLEKELAKLNERSKKWEEERKGLLEAKKSAESEAERLKAGSQIDQHRRSPTPSTMSTVSEGQQKFVINRLIAQVKQLNAELAQKSNENAELMMKLVEGGDE